MAHMTHLLNLINMMIYLPNIAIFIDLPLRALKKHQTGPAGWFSCQGHWSIFQSVEQLSKDCWKKYGEKLDNGKIYRRTHNNDPRPTLRLNDFTGTFRTA